MNLIEMSITAGILIIAIIIIRSLLLNFLPKITFPVLWGIVLIRLIFPFSFEIEHSLNIISPQLFVRDASVYETPSNHISENIARDILTVNDQMNLLNPIQSQSINTINNRAMRNQFANDQMELSPITNTTNVYNVETTNRILTQINWLIVIWVAGIVLTAALFIFGYLKSHQKLSAAVLLSTKFLDNWKSEQKLKRSLAILMSDQVTTPLTFGILKPKIILPANMDLQNSTKLQYVLAHEFYHIKRVDALWKLLAVIVLCVHWFNPFVWVAFMLANRDLEISCDEWVVKKFGKNTKKKYAYALIETIEHQNQFTSLASGFAKHATEERIKSIMKRKKTTVVGVAAAFAIIGILTFNAFAAPTIEYNYNEEDEEIDYKGEIAEDDYKDEIAEDEGTDYKDETAEDGRIEELMSLDINPLIAKNGINVNQVLLIDPTTGEVLTIYEFDEYEKVSLAKSLGNGYYAVVVGDEDFISRELRLSHIEGVVVDALDLFEQMDDPDYFPEQRIVIFDENLNYLETVHFDNDTVHPQGNILKFVDGELFMYTTTSIPGEVGESFGAFSVIPAYFQRINLHTGEITTLFEMNDSKNLIEFIGGHHILGIGNLGYVIIDLKTAEVVDLYTIIEVIELEDVEGLAAHGINVEAWESFGNTDLEIRGWNIDGLATLGVDVEALEALYESFDVLWNNLTTVAPNGEVEFDINFIDGRSWGGGITIFKY